MIKLKERMMLGERVRELAYWSLDFLKGRPVRKYYDEIQQAWREGTAPGCVDVQMDRLFRHTVGTVPFYQYLRNKKDLCLQDFPVLDKKRILEKYEEHKSSIYIGAKGNRIKNTSGSTGTPFSVVQDRNKADRNTAASLFLEAGGGIDWVIGRHLYGYGVNIIIKAV